MNQQRLFLSPKEISDALKGIGERKASAGILELFLFGILAGLYIGLGAQASLTLLSLGSPDPSLVRFLAASVFSVGLMLVLIPGAELFTGNILMTVGMADRRYGPGQLVRNWFIVYVGNFVGSLLLAWMVVQSGYAGNPAAGLTALGTTAAAVAETKIGLSFAAAFFRGVLCNMLVCLAVIMCIGSLTVSGKILGIYFPIMVFVACGYEHSIANMYFLPLGLMARGAFLQEFPRIWTNLVPVTLGNIVGGILLVVFHPKTYGRHHH